MGHPVVQWSNSCAETEDMLEKCRQYFRPQRSQVGAGEGLAASFPMLDVLPVIGLLGLTYRFVEGRGGENARGNGG
jgi:hypothetical protein